MNMVNVKYVSICDEDILNIENSIDRWIKTMYTTENHYDPTPEVCTLQSIIDQYKNKEYYDNC